MVCLGLLIGNPAPAAAWVPQSVPSVTSRFDFVALNPTNLNYELPATVLEANIASAQHRTPIAAGDAYTCALTTNSAVICWGNNEFGQLGDGTTIQRNTPVAVNGLSSGVVAIAAGYAHTCALTTSGGVSCWGNNESGQLGNGITIQRRTPVQVAGLSSGVAAIAAGEYHTCALTTDGAVTCWGSNGYGQLGDGTTTQRSTPVQVAGLSSGVTAITAGGSHTCALTTGGAVTCWGRNGNGQLGDGTTTQRSTPVNVLGLSSEVAAITAGDVYTCALTTGGGVTCWGANWSGQLGDGTTDERSTPVDVVGLSSGVTAIAAGNDHTCAITTGGGVSCWGVNQYSQLGDGTTTQQSTPVVVNGLSSRAAAIAAGDGHTCAMTTGGGVSCWGRNWSGQLGDGTTTQRRTPMQVEGLSSGVADITAGDSHTCALSTEGGVTCWGNNESGQLGDGTTIQRSTPVQVEGLSSGVVAITAGDSHTCALSTEGGVTCWGGNGSGQLGNGTTTQRSTPVQVEGLSSGVMAITAGDSHTCALTTGGGVTCWGGNWYGQLGDGTTTQRNMPVNVVGLSSGVAAIAAGGSHTCALSTEGGVTCWGWNTYDQLGDGTRTNHNTPVQVEGLSSGVAAIAAGYAHTCALITSGEVTCWGWNWYGQLGDGTTTQRMTPVVVNGLSSEVAAIVAGYAHTCALSTGGGVTCWGWNKYYQLGNGTISQRSIPMDVDGLSSGVAALAAGDAHTCGLSTGGGVTCWGWDVYGQLGVGTIAYRTTPVDVTVLFVYLPVISRN
ncbi:regulator of chromosome condensation RCC1 [Oscillochloris trichoides DG-6]|uniref:Regulator of chromosome condensation RCC1 n=1 Tax=Oscillochloris trichoides DG-6 TaxID=765420 RepID=E1IGQ1_9CHLR|nr:regulator of chromosome condensation RCC1 [Oscillochloris trichoides DG-6]